MQCIIQHCWSAVDWLHYIKKNALREIKLLSPYLQGKSTTMSVIAHQTEKEWISANEKNRQRMAQIHAEGAAEQHAARLEVAHFRAHRSCFTTLERCQPETAHLRQTSFSGEQSHNNSHLVFRFNPVADSRFRQYVLSTQ
ncbi:hypothetical protein TNCV_1740291 [Trichonephila clavipes]|uniref:Uncharacterized protein n=1 Tax=Trichonephila clavipes TaxID=2585209 RepID=A0A8X6RH20_TRICX|nr:hypothetical protein TNCV_1740291 [Trichonephila clavipes]